MGFPFLPLAVAGGSLLFNKLFGGGAKEPSRELFQIDMSGLDKYIGTAEKGLYSEMGDWLENAMRGVRGTAAGRGLTNTSYTQEMGDRAAMDVMNQFAPRFRELYSIMPGLMTQAEIAEMQGYSNAYGNWMQGQNQASSNWLSGMMGLMPYLMSGGGGATTPGQFPSWMTLPT